MGCGFPCAMPSETKTGRMEIDRTLFMNGLRPRCQTTKGVIARFVPRRGQIRRDKGQKRPPVGNICRLWP